MTSIPTLLSELDALAEKATPGPWLFDVPAPPPAERLDNATFLVELRNAYPTLRAEILRLREALEPFARIADELEEWWADDDNAPLDALRLLVGDLRRARAALKGSEGGE